MGALTSSGEAPSTEVRSFRNSFLAMLGVTLVYMLTAFNGSAVGTALPRMVAELGGFALYAWPASAFLVTSIVAIPIVGRLGDLQGRKRILLTAIALFAITSVACAAARSMEQLVVARALQGVGGGMVVGVLSACIADLFPESVDRMRWQVMHSVGFALAQGAGPWLGGWLTEHVSWRLVFIVNVPLATLAWIAIWRHFPSVVHHDGAQRHLDVPSMAWLTLSLICLVVWSRLVERDGLTSPGTLVCAGVALLSAHRLIQRQGRCAAPIVPDEVRSNRGTLRLLALGTLTGLTLNVLVFNTPLLLQAGLQLSAGHAGAVMTPLLLCVTVASVVNARIALRMARAEGLMLWGQLLLAAGCLMLTFADSDSSPAFIALGLGVCGTSFGFLLPNFTQHILVLTSSRNGGVASALGQASRLLGGLLGAALGWALVSFVFRESVHSALASARLSGLADLLQSPDLLLESAGVLRLRQAGLDAGADPEALVSVLRTAVTSAVRASYAACAALALMCAVISAQLPPFHVRRA